MISEGSRDTATWSKVENSALAQEYILKYTHIYIYIYIYLFYYFF